VLAGVYGRPSLAEALVFKGGTALKKAYFGDYRFSVDLDFTATAGPRGDTLLVEVSRVAEVAATTLGEHGPFEVIAERRPETSGHQSGQEAFKVGVQFPWQRSPLCSIKLEITVDEPVRLPVAVRPLLHGYGEELPASLTCYSLEETVAEKLRTMRQALRRLEEGRWLRNCSRDYYDLWRLCADPDVRVDLHQVAAIMPQKLSVRGVEAQSVEDYFPQAVIAEARRQWESSLGNLVRPLPRFEDALAELRESLERGLAQPAP
jgi:predicted nucleotidyltransferase component of viral defense system